MYFAKIFWNKQGAHSTIILIFNNNAINNSPRTLGQLTRNMIHAHYENNSNKSFIIK